MKSEKQIATEILQASFNRSLLSLNGLDLSDPKQLEIAESTLSYLLLSVRHYSSFSKLSCFVKKVYCDEV